MESSVIYLVTRFQEHPKLIWNLPTSILEESIKIEESLFSGTLNKIILNLRLPLSSISLKHLGKICSVESAILLWNETMSSLTTYISFSTEFTRFKASAIELSILLTRVETSFKVVSKGVIWSRDICLSFSAIISDNSSLVMALLNEFGFYATWVIRSITLVTPYNFSLLITVAPTTFFVGFPGTTKVDIAHLGWKLQNY